MFLNWLFWSFYLLNLLGELGSFERRSTNKMYYYYQELLYMVHITQSLLHTKKKSLAPISPLQALSGIASTTVAEHQGRPLAHFEQAGHNVGDTVGFIGEVDLQRLEPGPGCKPICAKIAQNNALLHERKQSVADGKSQVFIYVNVTSLVTRRPWVSFFNYGTVVHLHLKSG